jgi:hypothetical protein
LVGLYGGVQMRRKVILLNGPPGCGKDTIANELYDTVYCNTLKWGFKPLLIDIAVSIANIRRCDWDHQYSVDKEKPWNKLPLKKETGEYHSQRSWLIYVSEDIIKPTMGGDYFGQAALDFITDYGAELTVFADSGFESEIEPFCDVPKEELEICLVRIKRKGCTFTGDSRGYLMSRPRYRVTFDLDNNGTIEDAVKSIKAICGVE